MKRRQKTGNFGIQTETSRKVFQKNVKITADGICGAETWKKVVEHVSGNFTDSVNKLLRSGAHIKML